MDKSFWNGAFWSPLLKKDKKVLKFLNSVSEIFDPKHHKLRHQRGIYEHLKAITDFNALKKRAVQFTFANDRGDLVAIDGDIPNVDSACNPKPDSTLISVEYFAGTAPQSYAKEQGKHIIKTKDGGSLVVPPYAAVPRLIALQDPEAEDKVKVVPWGEDYESVAKDWGDAFGSFNETRKNKKWTWKDYLSPLYRIIDDKVDGYILHKFALYHYGRIQEADLYAHFSLVEFINYPYVSGYCFISMSHIK